MLSSTSRVLLVDFFEALTSSCRVGNNLPFYVFYLVIDWFWPVFWKLLGPHLYRNTHRGKVLWSKWNWHLELKYCITNQEWVQKKKIKFPKAVTKTRAQFPRIWKTNTLNSYKGFMFKYILKSEIIDVSNFKKQHFLWPLLTVILQYIGQSRVVYYTLVYIGYSILVIYIRY